MPRIRRSGRATPAQHHRADAAPGATAQSGSGGAAGPPDCMSVCEYELLYVPEVMTEVFVIVGAAFTVMVSGLEVPVIESESVTRTVNLNVPTVLGPKPVSTRRPSGWIDMPIDPRATSPAPIGACDHV